MGKREKVSHAVDAAAGSAAEEDGKVRERKKLAYAADAREAVVPPAPPAVGLHVGVE